jgi:phosphoribosylformylglycinamidine synthase subunit PurL
MVGLLARAEQAVSSHARVAGDRVFLLGLTRAELGGSAYWEAVLDCRGGEPPRVDLAAERRLVTLLVTAAERGLLRSAHDCSDGGLGVALAEVAMGGPYYEGGVGLDVDLTGYGDRLAADELLFSETQARAVVTCAPERATAIAALAAEHGVPACDIGAVRSADGELRLRLRDATILVPVARLREVYFSAIPRRLGD